VELGCHAVTSRDTMWSMSGFVKLHCSMLRSTIWFERPDREVFITALLMAEPRELTEEMPQICARTLDTTGWSVPPGWYGFCETSGPGLVRASGVDLEQGMAALVRLGSPEPESRSQAFEGRRLVRVDGGWIALNYDRYREKDTTAAERAARYRARKSRRDDTPVTRDVTCRGRSVTQAEEEEEEEAYKRDQNLPKSRKRSSAAPVQSALELTPPEPADPSVPKPPSDHAQLVTHYATEFERARQAKPCFGGREAKAVQSLLVAAQGDLERAKGFVTNAYTSPFWRDKATILDIAKDPSKFAGPSSPTSNSAAPPKPTGPAHPSTPLAPGHEWKLYELCGGGTRWGQVRIRPPAQEAAQ
jgi:hypothetical protein